MQNNRWQTVASFKAHFNSMNDRCANAANKHIKNRITRLVEQAEVIVRYMPNHAILDPKKAEPRIVFDTKRLYFCKLLNKQLLLAPGHANCIEYIITNMRQGLYYIIADIKDMFRSVWIAREDPASRLPLECPTNWDYNPRP